jgi:hypothetical protein
MRRRESRPSLPSAARNSAVDEQTERCQFNISPTPTPQRVQFSLLMLVVAGLFDLATEIGRIVRLPDVQAKILDFGFEPLGDTTEPFATFVNAQAERWAAAAKESGIEPQ